MGDETEVFCTDCFTYHTEGMVHASVDCSDCGCQHLGEEDKCHCSTSHCTECGCGAECGNCGCSCTDCECVDSYCGECGCGVDCNSMCAACFAHYESTGAHDPCGYGDVLEINEDCYYASEDYEYETLNKSKDDGRKFSVVDTESVSAKQVEPGGQYTVGTLLGLDRNLSMAEACADFYILERLYDSLHDRSWQYDVESDTMKLNGLRYPADWGKGTRLERLAYDVAATRRRLNTLLTRQFVKYIVMAVGGELRHAKSQAYTSSIARATPKSEWPKGPKNAWKLFPSIEHWPYEGKRGMGCAACAWYVESQKDVWKTHVMPCDRRRVKMHENGEHEMVPLGPSTMANKHCAYFIHWAEEHNIKVGYEQRTAYTPHTDLMREYLENLSAHQGGDSHSRGLAWRNWTAMYEEHGADLIQDCIDVFSRWSWQHSFGGKNWATAAEFVKDYLDEKIDDSRFLDRCWTLQHNGGNLFNKFYKRGLSSLPTVLDAQAEDDMYYTKLRRYASHYTKSLLTQFETMDAANREVRVY